MQSQAIQICFLLSCHPSLAVMCPEVEDIPLAKPGDDAVGEPVIKKAVFLMGGQITSGSTARVGEEGMEIAPL